METKRKYNIIKNFLQLFRLLLMPIKIKKSNLLANFILNILSYIALCSNSVGQNRKIEEGMLYKYHNNYLSNTVVN